jgi:GGDEF domain-containing protein
LSDTVRLADERILLIGDLDRQIQSALVQTLPAAQVTAVPGVFDAIGELVAGRYSTVLAAAEPIQRRPEEAVRALRELAGDGRLLLFGNPSFEPLSRKMLDFGADDYIVTPASPIEIQQMFGTPPLRLTPAPAQSPSHDTTATSDAPAVAEPGKIALLMGLPLADVLLEALWHHPNAAPAEALRQINARIGPTMKLVQAKTGEAAPLPTEGLMVLSHVVRAENQDAGSLHLILPRDEEESAARHVLAQLAHVFGKAAALQERHERLQKLAITDDLTGVYNGRYFRHFLSTILKKAQAKLTPVTLFLFDIDDFKKYNDQYGHRVGDEILKQTAALMRRCCRPHDFVARISGDEFAVVFWEHEPPRQPRDPNAAPPTGSRVPPSVQAVCDRFRRLISSPDFGVLGAAGQGTLSISGGLAVYPFHARTAEDLIEAADRELVFGAKRMGKNRIILVGEDPNLQPPQPHPPGPEQD